MLGSRRRRSERSEPVEVAPMVAELFGAAQNEAIAFRHVAIDTEHMLLALLDRDDETGRALRALGLDSAGVRREVRQIVGIGPAVEAVFDRAALGAIGIDLDAVRERAEATFGEGSLERARRRRGRCGGAAFGVMPPLKRALEQARRQAADRSSDVTAADVVLGLADQRGTVAASILEAHEISPERLRVVLR